MNTLETTNIKIGRILAILDTKKKSDLRRDPASVASHWISAYGDNQAAKKRGIKQRLSVHGFQKIRHDLPATTRQQKLVVGRLR